MYWQYYTRNNEALEMEFKPFLLYSIVFQPFFFQERHFMADKNYVFELAADELTAQIYDFIYTH
jgi:hypothetical protein